MAGWVDQPSKLLLAVECSQLINVSAIFHKILSDQTAVTLEQKAGQTKDVNSQEFNFSIRQ